MDKGSAKGRFHILLLLNGGMFGVALSSRQPSHGPALSAILLVPQHRPFRYCGVPLLSLTQLRYDDFQIASGVKYLIRECNIQRGEILLACHFSATALDSVYRVWGYCSPLTPEGKLRALKKTTRLF